MASKSTTPAARLLLGLSVGLVLGTAAQAAGLGRLTVTSALGQPLRAQVEVTSLDPREADSLSVRLAPASAFRAARLEFNPALSSLRIAIAQRSGGGALVRVTSVEPVNEPFLDLLLELTTSSSRVSREYTLLLDPPALKRDPEVVAPAVRAEPPRATASPAPALPATKAAATEIQKAAPATAPSPSTLEIKRGDTLAELARKVKPAWISLDQMMVAMLRANPQAFSQGNMNLLLAGSQLRVPSPVEAARVDAELAQREVIAQSRDFSRYRSRLVQTAAQVSSQAEQAAGHGRVSVKVQDKSAATTGDRLQIASTDAKDSRGVATRAADEAVARDRQMRELQERIEQLEQTNAKLQRALELQSRIGAQQQNSAAGKAAEATRKPAAEPTAKGPTSSAAVASAQDKSAPLAPLASASPPALSPPTPPATGTQVQAGKDQPPKDQPSKDQPAKDWVAKPAGDGGASAKKAATPAAVESPVQEESFLGYLWNNASVYLMAWVALLVAAIAAFLYRRRSAAEPVDADTALGTEPVFGESGMSEADSGEDVSAGPTDGHAASGGDDIAPVAEADIYLAYGRDDRAEEVLKEALRLHPDQLSIRSKLLELYAARKNKVAFNTLAEDFKERTQGRGEEWDRVADLGRELDPDSKLFALPTGAISARQTSAPAAEPGPHTDARDAERVDRTTLAVPSDTDQAARTTSPADGTQFESRPTFDSGSTGGTEGPSAMDTTAALLMPTIDLAAMPNLDLDLSLEPNSLFPGERRTEFGPPSEFRSAKEKLDGATAKADWNLEPIHTISDAAVSSVVASEMATKLDLARGYIDLGVRDGALELLDEVLRGGTPEQKLAANDLMRRLG